MDHCLFVWTSPLTQLVYWEGYAHYLTDGPWPVQNSLQLVKVWLTCTFSFSGFSVGSCINTKWFSVTDLKLKLFDWLLQLSSSQKGWMYEQTPCTIYVQYTHHWRSEGRQWGLLWPPMMCILSSSALLIMFCLLWWQLNHSAKMLVKSFPIWSW